MLSSACWTESEIMSSELGTQPVACWTTCSHCETRRHISHFHRHSHEFGRHHFTKPSKFVWNKNSQKNLKTFEIIAAALGITCDIKRHSSNMRQCSICVRVLHDTEKVYRVITRHSLQLVAPIRDNVTGALVRWLSCGIS